MRTGATPTFAPEARALRGGGRVVLPLALALLAACGPVDVEVARLPDGGERPRPSPCYSTADCPPDPDLYCDRPDGNAVGRCLRRPVNCPEAGQPVCGDSGVTYWNDCLRRSKGEPASTVGECSAPAACAAAADCPVEGASCARLTPAATCSASVTGACWVVPSCGPSTGSFCACGVVAPGVDLCTAIRAQTPFHPCP